MVGSALADYLVKEGDEVVGLDMLGDYPTVEVLTDFMKTNGVQRVFHLGARPFIPTCYSEEIVNVVNSNVAFTAALLVACKKAGTEKLLYFSTSEIYGNSDVFPISETNRPNPQSTYAASKFAAENLCRTFAAESGLDVVVLRHFNIYGPRDKHPRVIPKTMHCLKHSEPLVFGSLTPTRDFTYVDDAAISAKNVMEADTISGEIINHGSGVECSIIDVVRAVGRVYGKELSDDDVLCSEWNIRPWDVKRLVCDRRKYEHMFRSHRPISLEDGLKLTKEWYDKNAWPWEESRA